MTFAHHTHTRKQTHTPVLLWCYTNHTVPNCQPAVWPPCPPSVVTVIDYWTETTDWRPPLSFSWSDSLVFSCLRFGLQRIWLLMNLQIWRWIVTKASASCWSCLIWPAAQTPPAKIIYDPFRRNSAREVEGWISGPDTITIFHDHQAILVIS